MKIYVGHTINSPIGFREMVLHESVLPIYRKEISAAIHSELHSDYTLNLYCKPKQYSLPNMPTIIKSVALLIDQLSIGARYTWPRKWNLPWFIMKLPMSMLLSELNDFLPDYTSNVHSHICLIDQIQGIVLV